MEGLLNSNGTATSGTDAHGISQQLQNLLRIPPIDNTYGQGISSVGGRGAPEGGLKGGPIVNPIDNKTKVASIQPSFPPRQILPMEEKENVYSFGPEIPHLMSTPPPQQTNPNRHLMEINVKQRNSFGSNVDPVQEDEEAFRQMLQNSEYCPADVYDHRELIIKNVGLLKNVRELNKYTQLLDSKVRTILRNHRVTPLLKFLVVDPSDKFSCNPCLKHFSTLLKAVEHICSKDHAILEKRKIVNYTLKNIPIPSSEHCEAIGILLERISKEKGLSARDLLGREAVVKHVGQILKDNGIDCEVSMFGSSATGLGFQGCDLNINLSLPDEIDDDEDQGKQQNNGDFFFILSKITDIICGDPQFRDAMPTYNSQKPQLLFRSSILGVDTKCVMHLNNYPAVMLSVLLKEYTKINRMVKPVVLAFRYIAQICRLDYQEGGYLPSHAFTVMALHYMQAYGVIPVLHRIPRVGVTPPFATAEVAFVAGYSKINSETYSVRDLGRLWLSLLHYYSVEFDFRKSLISIIRPKLPPGPEKVWNRRMSIEDPITPSQNLARGLSSQKIFDYIFDSLKYACLYFATPCTAQGPLYDGIVNGHSDIDRKKVFTRCVTFMKSSNFPQARVVQLIDTNSPSTPSCDSTAIKLKMIKWFAHFGKHSTSFILYESVKQAHLCLRRDEYSYVFSQETLKHGVQPISCKACSSENHIRSDCPEENLPPLPMISPPNEVSLRMLESTIVNNFQRESLKINLKSHEIRGSIVGDVYDLLIRDFPDLNLHLFGSSENGFGMMSSDLDICLTLGKIPVLNKEDVNRYVDENKVLSKIVNALKVSPAFADVFSITTAKVPIVKFFYRPARIQGDICVYNILALSNTDLLKKYACIDIRAPMLGCLLKKLGKICDIGDASKGSLSSYSCILMLIHYLQHTEKPVLPVLQELPPISHSKFCPLPKRIVDNCDTYFFEDIDRVNLVWTGLRNSDSVEKLWLGFLKYYTEVFNFDENVITISQFAPLTKNEKGWHTNCIAIEDPFDKSHNLGSALTRRMSVYIIQTLRTFRKVFNADVSFKNPQNVEDFYFDKKNLSFGSIPIDRQCRRCYRIGHIARNCEEFNKNKNLSLADLPPIDDFTEVENAKQSNAKPTIPIPVQDEKTSNRSNFELQRNLPSADNHSFRHDIQMLLQPRHPAFIDQNWIRSQNLSILPDYRYFWNWSINQPRDQEDLHLVNMVTRSSRGVSFTSHVIVKAKKFGVNLVENVKGLENPQCSQNLPKACGSPSFYQQQMPSGPQPPPGFAPLSSFMPQSQGFVPRFVSHNGNPILSSAYGPMDHSNSFPIMPIPNNNYGLIRMPDYLLQSSTGQYSGTILNPYQSQPNP